ncbi:hypothetical protein [Maribacter sp.]|uniref:hypothetical protein n=1 Tax=Maribacter sp. TaxID=1897614 RepID=UPI001755D5E5|nr:hypothetical protein [Maribacter sp.]HDZ04459.1 hypothetical protein [Maribacter sp.]
MEDCIVFSLNFNLRLITIIGKTAQIIFTSLIIVFSRKLLPEKKEDNKSDIKNKKKAKDKKSIPIGFLNKIMQFIIKSAAANDDTINGNGNGNKNAKM